MNFLQLQHLAFSLDGRSILKDISFTVSLKEKLGIIGPSGCGKSVLLKCISGIYGDFPGQLVWASDSTPTIGFLFQEGALFDSMTVLQNVMFPLQNGRKKDLANLTLQNIVDQSAEMLNRVGLSNAIHKQANELSGGMRKRVGIARALVHNPKLLLLDEPTSGLDPVTANTIMDLIDELTLERQCTTIIVSHDLRRLLPRVPRTIAISDGVVVCDAPTDVLPSIASAEVMKFITTRFDFNNESGRR